MFMTMETSKRGLGFNDLSDFLLFLCSNIIRKNKSINNHFYSSCGSTSIANLQNGLKIRGEGSAKKRFSLELTTY